MTAKRDRLTGAGAQLVTEVTINYGSSLAGLLIPLVGSPVVVAVRQLVMAITVLPFYRPSSSPSPGPGCGPHSCWAWCSR